VKYSFICYL